MTLSTHFIGATISVTTIHLISGTPVHPAPIVVAGFASLLPDTDLPQGQMGRLCPPLSAWLYRKVGHRTLTHGAFGWAIVAIVLLPLKLIPMDISLYRAAMIGYISHGLLDLANLEGVALTYPLFPHHRWVFPGDGAYRVKANSSREQALRIVGTLLMTGLLALNLAGGRALFHSFLGTPAAIARDHASQLKHDRRLLVRVEGVWTRGQSRVSGRFEVIGSTDVAIFVRRPAEPMKVYQIGGDFSAISHPRLKIVRRLKAQQRVVTVKFSGERWREDLVAQYPNALVIGSVKTRASPPVFEPDEFPTILRFGDRWELTHAPIELVDKVLRPPRAKLTGNIQIRYWLKRGSDEHNKDHS